MNVMSIYGTPSLPQACIGHGGKHWWTRQTCFQEASSHDAETDMGQGFRNVGIGPRGTCWVAKGREPATLSKGARHSLGVKKPVIITKRVSRGGGGRGGGRWRWEGRRGGREVGSEGGGEAATSPQSRKNTSFGIRQTWFPVPIFLPTKRVIFWQIISCLWDPNFLIFQIRVWTRNKQID